MDVLEFRAVVRSVLTGPFAREDALLLSYYYATAAPWRQLMCAAEVLRDRLEQLRTAEAAKEEPDAL